MSKYLKDRSVRSVDILEIFSLKGYIPSEKIGQNIDPLQKSFFVTNYQYWTGTSVLQPFLGPPDPWGGLGGHGGF